MKRERERNKKNEKKNGGIDDGVLRFGNMMKNDNENEKA